MRRKYLSAVALILSFILSLLFSTGCSRDNSVVESKTIDFNCYDQTIDNLFDYVEKTENEKFVNISAIKSINSNSIDSIEVSSMVETENIDVAYDVQYDYESELIYLTISVVDENENLITVQTSEAYPIYYEDGSYDAQFDFDGKTVMLSEICSGTEERCFFFSLTMSLLAAKVVAATIVAAKVVAVVTGVVVVGYATYQVASMTKEKIQERERIAEREKSRDNPKTYYPATRKNGKLLIAAAPQTLSETSKNIVKNVDYWSPFGYNAKALAIRASGGYVGPEIDSNKDGYYYHYHLLNRKGGHSFFGSPSGGVF